MRPRYSFGSHHTGNLKNIRKQRAKYPKVIKEVIEISDIILEILDVRFIKETRNEEIERLIKKKNKKLIFVINKSDLTQNKNVNKETFENLGPHVFISAKSGRGCETLRRLIKMEAKRVTLPEGATRVQVGIIGYPNTGKSSVINKIIRRGVAGISKQAGHTKGIQKIRMSSNILILDTPGVIPETRYSPIERKAQALDTKLGARTFSDVRFPDEVVHYLMKDHSKEIEKFYGIDSKGDTETLIELLGRKKNLLKKGAQVDMDRTARVILKDWQEGKILPSV